jgi:hypothetical protein
VRRITGATGEIDHDGNAEFFSEQDGLATYFAIVAGACGIGVQRVAVATQSADGEIFAGQYASELRQGRVVGKHGEFAMGIAGVIAGAEFNG